MASVFFLILCSGHVCVRTCNCFYLLGMAFTLPPPISLCLIFTSSYFSGQAQIWCWPRQEFHPCQPAVPLTGCVSPHGSHQEKYLGRDLFLVLGSERGQLQVVSTHEHLTYRPVAKPQLVEECSLLGLGPCALEPPGRFIPFSNLRNLLYRISAFGLHPHALKFFPLFLFLL